MKVRIFGTESEYALFFVSGASPPPCHLSEEHYVNYQKSLAALLLEALSQLNLRRAGEFLENGGRLYIDRGGHPEYATPECRQLRDLLCAEKAGDRLLHQLAVLAEKPLRESGQRGRLRVFKNNLDSCGHSYGAHENYLVAPQVMDRWPQLIPFLVTRQILAGAGRVVPASTEEVPYQLSQRADFIERVYSDRTSGTRGIINTRRRDLPPSGANRRLHLILGDANLADYSWWLKLGTTSLVLRLLEEGALEHFPTLPRPVQALRKISRRLHTSLKMEGQPGRLTAIQIQALYWERAAQHFSSRTLQPEEAATLQLWQQTLEGLRRIQIAPTAGVLEEDPAGLRHRLDWLLKLWLLNRAQAEHGFDWRSPRSQFLDHCYHDLDPGSGLFHRCVHLNLVETLVSEEEILRALREPPQDTRARLRATIIRTARGRAVQLTIPDWEKIHLGQAQPAAPRSHAFDRTRRAVNQLKLHLADPFQADDPDILERVRAFVEKC
ncbi:MAG: proteasome accessory factor PafA2 family protein [Desulfobacca sp.]|uniref:proteasome accessory factor PafA2 family protein n=1 Tax=Desulfobacca sp. TaxID=2067990 RepID=UPI00404B4BA4